MDVSLPRMVASGAPSSDCRMDSGVAATRSRLPSVAPPGELSSLRRAGVAAGPTDSDELRDRAFLRGGVIREVKGKLIDITPAPVFRGIVALDDGMPGGMKVFVGVPVG